MTYKYLAQDEYDIIDSVAAGDGKKIKEQITITIEIEIDKSKYDKIKKKYKEHIGQKILKFFE